MRFGGGKYLLNAHELFWIATRGKWNTSVDRGIPGVIMAPRREHSRKPEKLYEIIERMYPDARKLELFARYPRAGWDVAFSTELPTTVKPNTVKQGLK